MKLNSKKIIVLSSILSCFNAYAAIPNTDNPSTFLGPTARGSFSSLLTDNSAYSVSGEVGVRNVRMGGSVGLRILEDHDFKLSGEFLWQQINYPYFAGNDYDWGNQGALGGTYQYSFYRGNRFNPQFVLNAYYAASANSTVTTKTGTFLSGGVLQTIVNNQRIAGAYASGISPGINLQLWQYTNAGFDLNYDSVRYDMQLQPSNNAKGFGATLHLNQQIYDRLSLGLSAGVRQPYNNYQANLAWNAVPCYSAWTFKAFGAYTVGKNSLPDTYNLGLSADYFLDLEPGTREENLRAEFLTWMAQPAVYMPQVLAVPDEVTLVSV